MEKVVAFLDLLAFSHRVRENTPEALHAFTTYRTIVETAWGDGQLHPVSAYPLALRDLAERTGIDSFEHFLPFSDSIFVSSTDPNKFIPQLGHFILNCFRFTAAHYLHPEDPANPTRTTIPAIGLSADGQLETSMKSEDLFPTLFRGGMAWGEAIPIQLFGLADKKPVQIANLAGKAVVDAVGLEATVKGPRIVFTEPLYRKLDAGARIYVHETEVKGFYELLWPGMAYVLENRRFDRGEFQTLFIPAVNLWRAHNHTPVAEHYFRFVELVVTSTLRVFDATGLIDTCLPAVRQLIDAQGLGDKMPVLLKGY